MKISPAIVLFISSLGCASAAEITIPMSTVNAEGAVKSIGSITITESSYGLVFSPSIVGIEAGIHGFHVHESPSCEPKDKDGKPVAALAAAARQESSSPQKR